MAARGSPATKKPKCDPSDLTRVPDAALAAQIEALDAEQRVADAAFNRLIILENQRSFIPRRATGFRVSLRLISQCGDTSRQDHVDPGVLRRQSVAFGLAACNTLAKP